MNRVLRNAIFYISTIGICGVLIYLILKKGALLQSPAVALQSTEPVSAHQDFILQLLHHLGSPLAILLAQIVTIIIVARIFAWFCRKIGQPTVIGEILAGIALGPSLLGWLFPEVSLFLFPEQSLGNLQFLSQIGLILFMFVIGMELDLKVLKNKANEVIIISHASIILPFAMGMGLAYFMYQKFAPEGVAFLSFALFIGIAMSITAFPVLARIVQERGLHKTRLGAMVITCAAADDISAWCLLAVVIAIVKAGSVLTALYTVLLAVVYLLLMFKIVRPFLQRVGDLHTSHENLSKPIVAIFFITLLISSFATEVIGIHALFGAFVTGAIMPINIKFRNLFIDKVEDISLVLLLPLFFVFTGLRTQIGLLSDVSLWQMTLAIIGVAIAGKFLGSALAARFVGQTWKDSFTIGALMNTRGLIELVVLNIGYDLGVLGPEIFAMMVVMALLTTFMTGPLLSLIEKMSPGSANQPSQILESHHHYHILISFARPDRGRSLLLLAHRLIGNRSVNAGVTAMHLTPVNELNAFNETQYERTSFEPIRQQAYELDQKITTIFRPSADIDADIVATANSGEYDLLMIGVGQSIFQGSLLGKVLGYSRWLFQPGQLVNQWNSTHKLNIQFSLDDRTQAVISKSAIPVAILVDKGLKQVNKIVLVYMGKQDLFLLSYAQHLFANGSVSIKLLKLSAEPDDDLQDLWATLKAQNPKRTEWIQAQGKEFIMPKNQDLILVSIQGWDQLVAADHHHITDATSALIISG